jgi:hypothetical protein
LQEADPAMRGAVGARALDQGHGVGGRPAAADREGEDAMQEVQVVLDGLGRQAVAALGMEVGLDLGGVDAIHRPVTEGRRQMAAQVPAVVGDRRALALHHVLEVGDVSVARLADRPPLALCDHERRVEATPQFALGLGARQPVGVARCALEAQLGLTRLSPTHHDPYQLARPPRSTTT